DLLLRRQGQKRASNGVELEPFQERERKRAAAAAFRADRNTGATEYPNVASDRTPVKHPDGLEKHCAKRLDIRRLLLGGRAALDQSDLHARAGVAQTSEIVETARRIDQPH